VTRFKNVYLDIVLSWLEEIEDIVVSSELIRNYDFKLSQRLSSAWLDTLLDKHSSVPVHCVLRSTHEHIGPKLNHRILKTTICHFNPNTNSYQLWLVTVNYVSDVAKRRLSLIRRVPVHAYGILYLITVRLQVLKQFNVPRFMACNTSIAYV